MNPVSCALQETGIRLFISFRGYFPTAVLIGFFIHLLHGSSLFHILQRGLQYGYHILLE